MRRDRIAAAVDRIERSTGRDEADRMADVRAMGSVPADVGPEIPVAPARGPVRMLDMMASYPKGDAAFEVKIAGFLGRKTLRTADSFDVMASKAARHGKVPPFSPAQVAMGRFYRDLVEKHECAGVRCSSLESQSQRGAGNGGEYMDAVLRDRERIAVLRRRIGSGSAMVVRRTGGRAARVTIMDRRLVDIVCLEDGTISDVLRAHGWADDGALRAALQVALSAVLDRMMGPVRRGSVSVAHFGSGCLPIWDEEKP